jgi:DTW domain-containing protein YfiP
MFEFSRKRKTKDPCPGCRLNKQLCICASIPRLDLRTRVSLIVHAKELKRTTNTGRLAIQALMNSDMRVRGQERERMDLSDLLDPDYTSLFFFPSEDATELTHEFAAQLEKPVQLIVPDGNWRQASKVHSRHPELRHLPRVKIAHINDSKFFLRKESSAEGMATLQAVAHALRYFEGEDAYRSLVSLYEAKLYATLKGRPPAIGIST